MPVDIGFSSNGIYNIALRKVYTDMLPLISNVPTTKGDFKFEYMDFLPISPQNADFNNISESLHV